VAARTRRGCKGDEHAKRDPFGPAAVTRPNVLLLAIDSLRADVVFRDDVPTPNIDRHAARGAAFTQCISTCTSTTPSFSSILTGCYPPKHGMRGLRGYRLNPSVTTMPECFAAAGYATHAEVAGPLLPQTGVLRGFEEARCRRAYKVPWFSWRDEIVAKMRAYRAPWLMLLHVCEVHRPYKPPPDYTERNYRAGYEAAVAAADASLAPVFEAAGEDTIVVVTGDHGEDYPSSKLEWTLGGVARRLRRKVRLAKWAPRLDRRFAGLEIGHGFALFEQLIRVPLVLSGPGVARARIDAQVRHVDLLPTLAELCGLAPPAGIDGRSLVPLMRGEELAPEPAYLEAVGVKLEGHRIVGARTPRWKLLRPGHGRPALYRLDGGAPPDEKHNVFGQHPDVVRELEDYIASIASTEVEAVSGMTSEEEQVVERHLADLGYL
jgi:arylsulfatase A-like enzyme